MGEHFVQEVKNTKEKVKNTNEKCPPKQILFNLLQKLHEGKAIELMARVQSKNVQTLRSTKSNNRKDPQRREVLGKAHVYKNLEALTTSFFSEGAVSLLETNEVGFGILSYASGNTRGKI
jgi:hypothetical protein